MVDCKLKNRNGSGSSWTGQTGMCLWLSRDFLQHPTKFCVAEAELVGGRVLLEEACRWGWAWRGNGFIPLLPLLSVSHVCLEGCDLSTSCLHPLWPCLTPRKMDSASGTKSQKKLFLPKVGFIRVLSHRIKWAPNTPSWSLRHTVWTSFRVIPMEAQPHWRDWGSRGNSRLDQQIFECSLLS